MFEGPALERAARLRGGAGLRLPQTHRIQPHEPECQHHDGERTGQHERRAPRRPPRVRASGRNGREQPLLEVADELRARPGPHLAELSLQRTLHIHLYSSIGGILTPSHPGAHRPCAD
jgi:hypothetical protein